MRCVNCSPMTSLCTHTLTTPLLALMCCCCCCCCCDAQNEPDAVTLLRSVVNAHHADITALAASRELGLVATGGADATLHIWDLAVRYIQ